MRGLLEAAEKLRGVALVGEQDPPDDGVLHTGHEGQALDHLGSVIRGEQDRQVDAQAVA